MLAEWAARQRAGTRPISVRRAARAGFRPGVEQAVLTGSAFEACTLGGTDAGSARHAGPRAEASWAAERGLIEAGKHWRPGGQPPPHWGYCGSAHGGSVVEVVDVVLAAGSSGAYSIFERLGSRVRIPN